MNICTIKTTGFSECQREIFKLKEKGLELINIISQDAEFLLLARPSENPPSYVTKHIYGTIEKCILDCQSNKLDFITLAHDDSDFLIVYKNYDEDSYDSLDDLSIIFGRHYGE